MSKNTNLNGDAGLNLFTALFTVNTIAEGTNAWGERCEAKIMIVPLAKKGRHEGVLSVIHHVSIKCA